MSIKISKIIVILSCTFFISVLLLSFVQSDMRNFNDGVTNEPQGNLHASESVDWVTDGIGICMAVGDQITPQILSDGTGGAFIVWQDRRGGLDDIYAQRINSAGDSQWTNGGVGVCTYTEAQVDVQFADDGDGGIILTWADRRTGTYDIYAQRVNSTGDAQWTPNGIVICNETGIQSYPQLVSDGNGGAIIVWSDQRSGTCDVYGQRINSNGDCLWTANGTVICAEPADQAGPYLVDDGDGGAIIAWHDSRTGDAIYAQRINSTGDLQWTASGVPICTVTGLKFNLNIIPDDLGGAIIVWMDTRSAIGIYVQRVNSAGTKLWATNGNQVYSGTLVSVTFNIISDGSNGAILTWTDPRSGNNDIYAQRVNSGGSIQWTSNGVPVCTATDKQDDPQLESDGSGGAIISWKDNRTGSYDIYAQRVNSTGIVRWNADGIVICAATGDQYGVQLVADESGNVILTWWDHRSGAYDIYSQRVSNLHPQVNQPEDVSTTTKGTETLDWILMDDQGPGYYRVIANDTVGGFYEWVGLTSWVNNSALNVPINRTSTGEFNFTIEYADDQGAWGLSDTIIVVVTDAPPSDLTIVINGGALDTSTLTVTLTLAATDATDMCFSNNGSSYTAWEPYNSEKIWVLEEGLGLKTVYFKARYNLVEAEFVTDTINYTLPPSGLSISINNGDEDTNSLSVLLTLSATGATEMCFSNNGTTYSAWEGYSTSKTWMLTGGTGLKSVYFKARNSTIESSSTSDDITYTLTPSGLSISINGGAIDTGSPIVVLVLSALSVSEMCFSNNGSTYTAWEPYTSTKDWILEGNLGINTVYFKARNRTIEAGAVADTIYYVLPPTGLSIIINNGAGITDTLTVTLTLAASDATEMCFSNDGVTWSVWEQFTTTKTWTLSSEAGLKTIYFKARNSTIEAMQVSDSITYSPPTGSPFPWWTMIIVAAGVIVVVVAVVTRRGKSSL